MFEPMELTNDAVIKVIGVGGGGGNAVEHMVRERIEGVEFFAVNTDAQALRKTAVGQTIQIGSGITKGLGAGANPEVGRNAADEDRDALRAALEGALEYRRKRLGLTPDERAERVPSGVQHVYKNRNGWAHDRLKRAGLSTSPKPRFRSMS